MTTVRALTVVVTTICVAAWLIDDPDLYGPVGMTAALLTITQIVVGLRYIRRLKRNIKP